MAVGTRGGGSDPVAQGREAVANQGDGHRSHGALRAGSRARGVYRQWSDQHGHFAPEKIPVMVSNTRVFVREGLYSQVSFIRFVVPK